MTGFPRIFSSASATGRAREIGLPAGRKRHDHVDIARRPRRLRKCRNWRVRSAPAAAPLRLAEVHVGSLAAFPRRSCCGYWLQRSRTQGVGKGARAPCPPFIGRTFRTSSVSCPCRNARRENPADLIGRAVPADSCRELRQGASASHRASPAYWPPRVAPATRSHRVSWSAPPTENCFAKRAGPTLEYCEVWPS